MVRWSLLSSFKSGFKGLLGGHWGFLTCLKSFNDFSFRSLRDHQPEILRSIYAFQEDFFEYVEKSLSAEMTFSSCDKRQGHGSTSLFLRQAEYFPQGRGHPFSSPGGFLLQVVNDCEKSERFSLFENSRAWLKREGVHYGGHRPDDMFSRFLHNRWGAQHQPGILLCCYGLDWERGPCSRADGDHIFSNIYDAGESPCDHSKSPTRLIFFSHPVLLFARCVEPGVRLIRAVFDEYPI